MTKRMSRVGGPFHYFRGETACLPLLGQSMRLKCPRLGDPFKSSDRLRGLAAELFKSVSISLVSCAVLVE